MIIRFLKAMVQWALSGFKTSHKELVNKRTLICESCEYYLSSKDKCMECGCNLLLKRKIKNQNCPIGKW
mgnify:CR=1 FL=1